MGSLSQSVGKTAAPMKAPAARPPARKEGSLSRAVAGGGRKRWEGGFFRDILDTLTATPDWFASNLLATKHEGAEGAVERWQHPDENNFREFWGETLPGLEKSLPGRAGLFALDVGSSLLTDPTTYVGGGLYSRLAKTATKGASPAARVAARTGMAAIDPIGELAVKPLAAAGRAGLRAVERGALGETAQKGYANVVGRLAQRRGAEALFDPMTIQMGMDERAIGASARRYREEVNRLAEAMTGKKATGIFGTNVGADDATRELAGEIDRSLGRVFDSGFDASTRAMAETRAEQAATLRTARREMLIPARQKAARLEGRMAETVRHLDDAKAMHGRTAAKIAEAEQAVKALAEQRATILATLNGATERSIGRAEGRAAAATGNLKRYVSHVDTLEQAKDEAAKIADRLAEAKAGPYMTREMQRAGLEDASHPANIADSVIGRVTNRDAGYRTLGRNGQVMPGSPKMVSIGDLDENERSALYDFLGEYGARKETRFVRELPNGERKIVSFNEPEQFDQYIPRSMVESASRNFRAAQRAEYSAAREAAAGEAESLTRELVKASGRARKLATQERALHRTLARAIDSDGPDGAGALQALAQLRKTSSELDRQRGRLSALKQSASQRLAQVDRLTTRRDRMAALLDERRARVEQARETLTSPAARDAREAEAMAAAEAAKSPAIERGVKDMAALGVPEAEARDLYRRMAAEENAMGARRYAAGLDSPTTRALYHDVHLRREYLRNMAPDEFLRAVEDDPAHFAAVAELNAKLKEGAPPRVANAISRALKRRKPLTPEMRKWLIPIEEAGVRHQAGQKLSARAIAQTYALENVGRNFGLTRAEYDDLARAAEMEGMRPEQALNVAAGAPVDTDLAGPGSLLDRNASLVARSPNHYVEVSGAKYGPLNGMFVPEEVFNVINRELSGRRAKVLGQDIPRWYRAIVSAWKIGKVVLSPAARIRNIKSNMVRAYTEWGIQPPEMLKTMWWARQEIKAEGPEFLEALRHVPSMHQTEIGAEIGRDTAVARAAGRKASKVKDFGDLIAAGAEKIGLGVKPYENDELMGKLAIWKILRERGMSPKEAAKGVERTLFDYRRAPRAAAFASDTGLIPFARYPSLAVPAEARNIARTPGRYYKAAKVVRGVEGFGQTGDSSAVEASLSDRERNKALIRMPGGMYYDLTYDLPIGAVMGGENVSDTLNRSVNPLRANPVANAAVALTSNRDPFTRQDIRTDPRPAQGYAQIAKWVGSQALPTLTPGVGFGAQQIQKALSGATDYTGRDRSAPEAIASYALGMKVQPMDRERNLKALGFEIKRNNREASRRIAQLRRQARNGEISEEEFHREGRDILAWRNRENAEIRRRAAAAMGEDGMLAGAGELP